MEVMEQILGTLCVKQEYSLDEMPVHAGHHAGNWRNGGGLEETGETRRNPQGDRENGWNATQTEATGDVRWQH